MPIAALVAFSNNDEKFEFHASWSLGSGAELGEVEIEIEGEVRPDDFAHVPIPKIVLALSSPDELILKAWKSGDEPREIGRLRIELAPPASKPAD